MLLLPLNEHCPAKPEYRLKDAVTRSQVARAGRIVLLSFHQPSPAMFETLDRVFLMARGRVVFCGDPGSSDGFFEAAGLACPSHTAIAEHMLSAVSDPPMLARLQAHVAQNGPFAGMALVRPSLLWWCKSVTARALWLQAPWPQHGFCCKWGRC